MWACHKVIVTILHETLALFGRGRKVQFSMPRSLIVSAAQTHCEILTRVDVRVDLLGDLVHVCNSVFNFMGLSLQMQNFAT